MSNNPLVLTFDCGTQSMRALLVDSAGTIVAKEQEYFAPYYASKPGYAEQNPAVYVDAMVKTSKQIHFNNPGLADQIVAVTITTFRDTCLCLDKNNQPLRDAIVWLDQREAECKTPMPLLNRAAFGLVGMSEALKAQRKITKSNWIIENQPEIWAKTAKYAVISAYFVWLFTGKLIDSTASQVAHIPYDFKTNTWFKKNNIKFPLFNVDEDKLIDILEPGKTLGLITKEASQKFGIKEGLPLIATGSDKGCETLGCGVLDNNLASLSFGTSATIQTSMRRYMEPQQFMPAYPGLVAGTWNPEIQIFRGYWMVNWFKKEFAQKEVVEAKALNIAPENLLNQRLKEIPPGADGLLLQPYWGPSLKIPEAKGSVIGFSDVHTRIHIYKAIIEGINYGLIDGINHIEKRSKQKITAITVSGGGSQSDEICQITADMFGRPVHKIQTYEACGLGSSIVAFVALGIHKDFPTALKAMVHYTKTYQPNLEHHRIYQKLYQDVYRKIYPALSPLYIKLRGILSREGGANE